MPKKLLEKIHLMEILYFISHFAQMTLTNRSSSPITWEQFITFQFILWWEGVILFQVKFQILFVHFHLCFLFLL
jgi:hypothetical protein